MKFKSLLLFSAICIGVCCSCSDDSTPVPEPDPEPTPEEKPEIPPVTIDFPNNQIPQLAFTADGGS